jgi:elongation factor Ts
MGGKIAVVSVIKGANDEVAKDVAMQAAAMKPKYVFRADVPEEEIAREREVLKEQAMNEGKPADIAEKMVEGRLNKFFKEICLAEQAFIKDGDIDVTKYVTNNGGEIVGCTSFVVGEGIEKRQDNFAEEVMAQING